MNELPEPLVSKDCDCRDLDGFMLNVERIMASELVALASPAVIGSALLLWCRAWKQMPAASLPDDDAIIAAFAKLTVAQLRKVRSSVLRGFVKCSDGRLYHRVLAVEAMRAFERKKTFQKKRSNDAERLRKWRGKQPSNGDETPTETHHETRFVAEGQGQGQGQVREDSSEAAANSDSAAAAPPRSPNDLHLRLAEVIGDKMHPTALWHAGEVQGWIASGADLELDILPVIAVKVARKPGYYRSLSIFAEDVAIATQRRKAGLPKVEYKIAAGQNVVPMSRPATTGPDWKDETTCRRLFDRWKSGLGWIGSWGAEPDRPNCRIPRKFLDAWLLEVAN